MESAKKYLKLRTRLLKKITVEPIGTVSYFGYLLFSIAQIGGIYQVICRSIYNGDPEVLCEDLKRTPWAQDMVQKEASTWSLYFSLARIFPVCMSSLILGAWGDEKGRQVNILVGLAGVSLSIFFYVIVLQLPSIHIYYLVIFDFFVGWTGGSGMIPVSCMAYIADTTLHPHMLTIRMTVYLICQHLGAGLGALSGGVIAARLSDSYAGVIGLGLVASGSVYTAYRIPQRPPLESKIQSLDSEKSIENSRKMRKQKKKFRSQIEDSYESKSSQKGLLRRTVDLQLDSLKCYTKQRKGHRRAFMVICAFTYFIFMSINLGMSNVTVFFTFRRPINWEASMYGYYVATGTLTSFVGNIAGVFILKRGLSFSDTGILLFALLSMMAKYIIISFATGTMMFVSNLSHFLADLAPAALKSVIAQMIRPDEVGKVYAIFAVGLDLGVLGGHLLYNTVYAATESYAPNAVFLLGLAELIFCFFVCGWMHLKSKSERTFRL